MSSMNEGYLQGSTRPSACAAAITSVAVSSTTLNPSSSNRRIIAVFPAPGAPVMMNRFIALNSICVHWFSFVAKRFLPLLTQRVPPGPLPPRHLLVISLVQRNNTIRAEALRRIPPAGLPHSIVQLLVRKQPHHARRLRRD